MASVFTRRMSTLLACLSIAAASAEPFVWPDAWTAHPGQAIHGGTFRLHVDALSSFNAYAERNDLIALLEAYEARLFRRGPDSDAWLPYAAESFTIGEDGLVVDVVLREGIAWSDGTPVTTRDYLLRFQLETDPEVDSVVTGTWYFRDASGIQYAQAEALDARHLRFRFPRSDRANLESIGTLVPAPDHILGEIYREEGAAALRAAWTFDEVEQTAWTGPFVPVSAVEDEQVVLERNPYFGRWNVDARGNELPYLDGFHLLLADDDRAFNLYLMGELDSYAPRGLDEVVFLRRAIEQGELDAVVLENASPAATSQFIAFNWNKADDPFRQELFRRADFRRAMSHLVDREAIVEQVYAGSASPMWSSVYQVLRNWVNPDVPRYPYDPEEAARLLAGLGFSRRNAAGILVDADGNELSFTLLTNEENSQRVQIARIFADRARVVGVKVEVETPAFGDVVERILVNGDARPFDAVLIGLRGVSRTWPMGRNVIFCDGIYHVYNLSGSCLTPQETLLEELLEEGAQTLDDARAIDIAFEMQRIEADQQFLIYTVSDESHFSWLSHVRGNHPLDLIAANVGERELPLTFKVP